MEVPPDDVARFGKRNVPLEALLSVDYIERVAPCAADAAGPDASICLLAFGNAGSGPFGSVESC